MMKGACDYLEYRRLDDGRVIAIDWLSDGRGVVVIGTGHGQCGWEYSSVSAALGAWFAWEPAKSLEPAGYERRSAA